MTLTGEATSKGEECSRSASYEKMKVRKDSPLRLRAVEHGTPLSEDFMKSIAPHLLRYNWRL